MEREFERRYKRQEVPSSLALQSDIIELSRSLPQQTKVEASLFTRLLSRLEAYASLDKQPVFKGALASVLVISACVFLLNTVVFKEQVNQADYSASLLMEKPSLVEDTSIDSFNEFSANDYDWQEIMLLEDEFLLASL